MAAFTVMTGVKMESSEDPFLETREEDLDTVVCSGSPVANPYTGLFLPCAAQNSKEAILEARVSAEALPYHFYYGAVEEIYVRSGMHPGQEKAKRNHGLFVRSPEGGRYVWRPRDFTEVHQSRPFLARDFLLISHVPRNARGGDVILMSGGHGAGTQSLELLLDPLAFPIEGLRFLAQALRGCRYFQFVLEAFDMVHDPPMTRARHLEVSRECPPVPVVPTEAFFRVSMQGALPSGSTLLES